MISVDTPRDVLSVQDSMRKQSRGVTEPVAFTRQDVLDAAYLGAGHLAVCQPEADKFYWAMLWLINKLEHGDFALPKTVDLISGEVHE